MAHRLKNLSITRVALVAAGSNPLADVVLFKNKPVVSPQPKEPVFMKKNIDKSKLSVEEQTQLEALLAKSATDITDPAPPKEKNKEDEIIKSLPAEAQAILNKAKADAAEAVETANRATATALLEKSAREQNEFVAKNSNIVKAFPGKADETAEMLYRVKKVVAEADYAALETLLKAGGAALASATTEKGTSQGDSNPSLDALETLAKARQTEKGITYSEAYEQIINENPEKVKEIRKEKRRRQNEDDNN